MLRESRGSRGRLLFFTLCIAVGVTAVVGVAALAQSLEEVLRAQGRDLLAADLLVSSRRPIDPELDAMVRRFGATATTHTREFASMVAPIDAGGVAGSARLARVKSVRGTFPLSGVLELDPPGLLSKVLEQGVAVAPELGIPVGSRLRLGNKVLQVRALVRREPQPPGVFSVMGPRVFVAEDAIRDSGLAGVGSRMRYELLARYPGDDVERLAERMRREAKGAEYLRIESWRAGQPRVRDGIARVERFLGLVALLSLILGGIGVAQVVRAWIEGRTPAIAVLRCLGMRPREILLLFVGQVLVFAFVGSVLGAALGALVPRLLGGVLLAPLSVDAAALSGMQSVALLKGIGLGVGIALLFSLPPLTAVWRVSPARVLRAEVEPLPAPGWVRYGSMGVLGCGLLTTAALQAGRLIPGLWFTAGFFALAGVLALGARVVMRAVSRLPRRGVHPYLVQGLTALARPGAGTLGGVVALGLGVAVVSTLWIVEHALSSGLRTLIPADAPTVFLVDVQPDQWEAVERELRAQGASRIVSAPVVMGRLRAINGRPVRDILEQRGGQSRWTLTREQRLSPMATLPADSRVVAGALWSDPNAAEISLERRYARDMGVELGDVLRIDVQGVAFDLKLTSLREVEWRSFTLNFFVAVEPGVLDDAPGFRLAAARLPPEREQPLQNRLAQAFPNVAVLRVGPILDTVVGLIESMAVGVRLLGWFTVAAGLVILGGAIGATTLRRRREAALLKTLGATRRGVGVLMGIEFGMLGGLAGTLGAVGGSVLAWAFLTLLADLAFPWPLWLVPAAAVGGALLAIGCGLLASWRALHAPPRAVLAG
ncbi:MAG: FtsX-like permease family protein [Planctomycetes bacterium]|nr:FtsX-like permease family protein [Planctomycetota bacterium]